MKKNLFFVCIMALASAAFGQSGKYTIKGTFDNRSNDGKTALLEINHSNGDLEYDSCVVKKGKFSFKGKVEEPMFATVFLDNSEITSCVVLEPGTIHIDDYDAIMGTPQNEALSAYRKSERSRQNLLQLYQQNEHNLVAVYAMKMLLGNEYLTSADLDNILKTASPKVVEKFANQVDILRARENTMPGKTYVDIPGAVNYYREEQLKWEENEGSMKEIIDGKPAVVVFWDYVYHEIKNDIDSLYNQYKDKGLVVMGVGISREPERHNIIEDGIYIGGICLVLDLENFWYSIGNEHVRFPQLIVPQKSAASIYGIGTKPDILFIAPDGTILERSYNVETIKEAVTKALKKKN